MIRTLVLKLQFSMFSVQNEDLFFFFFLIKLLFVRIRDSGFKLKKEKSVNTSATSCKTLFILHFMIWYCKWIAILYAKWRKNDILVRIIVLVLNCALSVWCTFA